jgi:circadian clock protein KaiC
MHLVQVHKMVSEFKPAAVVIDPVSNFISNSTAVETQAMLLRLVDFLKEKQITALFTHLTSGGSAAEATDVGISSLVDTWLLVRNIEIAEARTRGLYVLKSRGMPHSHEIREFLLTPRGIQLKQVRTGKAGKAKKQR